MASHTCTECAYYEDNITGRCEAASRGPCGRWNPGCDPKAPALAFMAKREPDAVKEGESSWQEQDAAAEEAERLTRERDRKALAAKGVDYRRDTKGMKLRMYVDGTERKSTNPLFIAGGRKVYRLKGANEGFLLVAGNVLLANGDQYHAVFDLSEEDGGELFGITIFVPDIHQRCGFRAVQTDDPNFYIEFSGIRPDWTQAVPGANGEPKPLWVERTYTKADVFPLKYHYDPRCGIYDHHVDEVDGWSF